LESRTEATWDDIKMVSLLLWFVGGKPKERVERNVKRDGMIQEGRAGDCGTGSLRSRALRTREVLMR
jgi:hypothetical protein